MDSAFGFIETRPAAGPLIFPRGGHPRARPATNRAIPLVLKRIVRNLMLLHVSPDLVPRPRGHGVQFQDVTVPEDIEMVELKDPGLLPRIRLLPAHPRHPHGQLLELALQRHHLAQRAAKVRLGLP